MHNSVQEKKSLFCGNCEKRAFVDNIESIHPILILSSRKTLMLYCWKWWRLMDNHRVFLSKSMYMYIPLNMVLVPKTQKLKGYFSSRMKSVLMNVWFQSLKKINSSSFLLFLAFMKNYCGSQKKKLPINWCSSKIAIWVLIHKNP